MNILNLLFGLLSFICVIGIIVGPIGLVVSVITEGGKPVAEGQKRLYKMTKLFAVISVMSFVGLIVGLALWGLAVFALASSVSEF